MKMEQTECSETSVYKIQTPGNYPEESIKHEKLYASAFQTTVKEKCWPTYGDEDGYNHYTEQLFSRVCVVGCPRVT